MIQQYLSEALSNCERLLEAQPAESADNNNQEQQLAPTDFSQAGQEWMEACQTVANILNGMGFVQEAYPWRSMALDLVPSNAKFYAESGRVCSQCEDWEQAIYFCQRALEYKPNNAAVHRQLAQVYYQIGDRTAEVTTLNNLLAQRPDQADAAGHYRLGQVLRGQNQIAAAITCYQRAIAQDNQYESAYYALGDLRAQQGHLSQTVELFAQMVQHLPKIAQAHYRLGRAYKQTQQLERAIDSFQSAIALDPHLNWAYMGLLNVLMQRNRFDEAIATCQSIIQDAEQGERDTAWVYCFMGNAQAKKGEPALAALAHQQAFALRGWRQASERDYQFRLTWFSENISTWWEYLKPLGQSSARHPIQMLSLGTQDDSGLLWLADNILTASKDRLFCLSDCPSDRLQENREKLPEPDKLVLQTEEISAQVENLTKETLDFIYVQSDCKQADYLQSVSRHLWKALKPAGLMCFKDYHFAHPSDPSQSSKVGIDAFIDSVEEEVEILYRSHQVILRKSR